MSGTMAEQDNSIEEILASIRQIISDDDPKAAENSAAVTASADPVPAVSEPAAPAPVSSQGAVDDIFDLVDEVEEKPDFSVSEPEPAAPAIDVSEPPIEVDLRDPTHEADTATANALDELQKMADQASTSFAAPMVSAGSEDSVFSGIAAAATLGAFSKLSETVTLERQRALAGSVTLEDIVKELLTPILRQWIDQHVPGLVERLVREELEKLARQAREG